MWRVTDPIPMDLAKSSGFVNIDHLVTAEQIINVPTVMSNRNCINEDEDGKLEDRDQSAPVKKSACQEVPMDEARLSDVCKTDGTVTSTSEEIDPNGSAPACHDPITVVQSVIASPDAANMKRCEPDCEVIATGARLDTCRLNAEQSPQPNMSSAAFTDIVKDYEQYMTDGHHTIDESKRCHIVMTDHVDTSDARVKALSDLLSAISIINNEALSSTIKDHAKTRGKCDDVQAEILGHATEMKACSETDEIEELKMQQLGNGNEIKAYLETNKSDGITTEPLSGVSKTTISAELHYPQQDDVTHRVVNVDSGIGLNDPTADSNEMYAGEGRNTVHSKSSVVHQGDLNTPTPRAECVHPSRINTNCLPSHSELLQTTSAVVDREHRPITDGECESESQTDSECDDESSDRSDSYSSCSESETEAEGWRNVATNQNEAYWPSHNEAYWPNQSKAYWPNVQSYEDVESHKIDSRQYTADLNQLYTSQQQQYYYSQQLYYNWLLHQQSAQYYAAAYTHFCQHTQLQWIFSSQSSYISQMANTGSKNPRCTSKATKYNRHKQ